jgi:hypothetical protein
MSQSRRSLTQLLPRLIRLRHAPFYLGMDRNRFNTEVRSHLTAIPVGKQGVAFDRLDLDAWVDEYKSRNGRPGQLKGDQLWDARERPGSTSAVGSGTSTSGSEASAFARALERAISGKGRKSTSQRERRKSDRRSSKE